jgi:Rrf2 family transcriptional regulator, iron-sulfur cluster assembly transcription factor
LPMPLLARKSILAIAAVTDIAVYAGTRPVTARALASRYGLPARHLEPVLQALVRHGILKGIRGPRGGYELARERSRISADQILSAAANTDDEAISPAGSQLLDEVIIPALSQAEHAFSTALARISVEDLTQSAHSLTKASRATEHTPLREPRPLRGSA